LNQCFGNKIPALAAPESKSNHFFQRQKVNCRKAAREAALGVRVGKNTP
jgi:hypothetical protein